MATLQVFCRDRSIRGETMLKVHASTNPSVSLFAPDQTVVEKRDVQKWLFHAKISVPIHQICSNSRGII